MAYPSYPIFRAIGCDILGIVDNQEQTEKSHGTEVSPFSRFFGSFSICMDPANARVFVHWALVLESREMEYYMINLEVHGLLM